MTSWKCTAAALAVLSLSAGAARAQTLYGITFNDQLITINPTTAAGTVVGPLSTPMNAFGLAFRGSNLYTWDQTGARIRELNPATGATINTINIGASAAGEGDMAFRSDGMGFLTDLSMVRFDITVPSSTTVGLLSPTFDGLAFNAADVLYGLTSEGGTALYTINVTTGATTLVGNTGIVGPFVVGGLAFDGSGNLFAALSDGTTSPSFLYRINTTTGVGTLVGNIGINAVSGIRFQGGVGTVPPQQPPPGAEGSFPGSTGSSPGSEGSYGFGGRLDSWARPGRLPLLLGPIPDRPGSHGALNVAHRRGKDPAIAPQSQGADRQRRAQAEDGLADWVVGAGVVLALMMGALFVAKKLLIL